ncbi:hypothetical protein A1O7_04856 [Cladophialophora yegresii CBS 114405]|uniref:Uncharacterized protein n=1 Tax=Cladophialophora yegresii CBS 114405 TaxID=1182544 RepID=W9VYD5_9EURO|nr:uncharacterized protein A1O7_04856 [Cladophialophora yegresii CBS 114405]EXJ60703.1 hypothetical protein A1O7_04856 [Cladophialophora yegresii CBS 114405]
MVRSPTELCALDENLEKHEIPQRLAFEVEVQRCMAKYHDSLVGEAEYRVYETLVQMCEQELNSVADRYRSSMDAYLTLHLQTTQLHLYTLAILRMKSGLGKTGQPDTRDHVSRYQKLGMLAAHRVIDTYCDNIRFPDTRLIDVHRALPNQTLVSVLHATFFLLRYFVLNLACEGDIKAESTSKVLMVHAKLKEHTSHQFAEPGRAAAVIEVLWRHGEEQVSDTSEDIDDRGDASLSWSALIAAANLRRKRNLKAVWL